MTSLLEAAITHARNGYHVFPCKPKDKRPATPNGFKDATTDETTIRAWWKENPEYNIGLPTGTVNGFWTLDVDGSEGHKSLRTFEQDVPKDVPVVHTPNNGSHLYFAYDERAEELSNTVRSIPGLDVRTEGGYVIAAGSVLDVGEYRYRSERTDPVEAPTSLVSALVEASKRVLASRPVEATIEDGSRNSTLFSRARSLFKQGYDGREVYGTLAPLNENRCKPPLETSELVQIVQSAGKYERGELRVDTESSSSSSLGSGGDDYDCPTFRSFAEMSRPTGNREYIVEGVLFKGFAGAIYGDGGTAKSLLMMHFGQSVARGVDWHGFTTVKTKVLYLDFELDEDEQSRRAYDVAAGMGFEEPPEGFYYLSAAGYPPREMFDQALAYCKEHGIGMVIVDSLGYALVGDAEASKDVLLFFREVEGGYRRDGISLMIVDHQPKGGRYQERTMFGSVYKSNSIRSVFQVEPSEHDGDYLNLTMRHTKVNFGPKLPAFGIRVEFGKDRIAFVKRELDDTELATETTANAKDRVKKALQDGPMFPYEIEEVTDLDHGTVKNTLSKLRKAEVVQDTGSVGKYGAKQVRLTSSSSQPDLRDDYDLTADEALDGILTDLEKPLVAVK